MAAGQMTPGHRELEMGKDLEPDHEAGLMAPDCEELGCHPLDPQWPLQKA